MPKKRKKRKLIQTNRNRNEHKSETTYDTRNQSNQKFEVFECVHWYGQIGCYIPNDQLFCSIN